MVIRASAQLGTVKRMMCILYSGSLRSLKEGTNTMERLKSFRKRLGRTSEAEKMAAGSY